MADVDVILYSNHILKTGVRGEGEGGIICLNWTSTPCFNIDLSEYMMYDRILMKKQRLEDSYQTDRFDYCSILI